MTKTEIETQVTALVASIVEAAMQEEFEEAMKPFADRISPQLHKTFTTVFQAGVEIGAARALARIAGVK